MRPQLIIANKNYSSWSMRAWLALKIMGVDFDERRIPFGEDFDRQIKAVSKAGRVPVLLDDGLVIWDSMGICEYANEMLAPGRGWPTNHRQRAIARCLAAEIHSGFPNLRAQMPFNLRTRIKATPSQEVAEELVRVRQIAEQVQDELGKLCITHAYLIPTLLRLRSYGVGCTEEWFDLPYVREWEEEAARETERQPQYDLG